MKVLLPVDGSHCANKLLEWAATFLESATTEFYILSVIPSGGPRVATESFEIEETLKTLKEAEAKVKALGGNVVKAEYVEGDAVESICQYAEAKNIDQVMISSHGRTGLAKIVLGSVSNGVLEYCKKPVIVYKNMG